MKINVGFALMLATLAGLSTGIGSSIAYFISSLLVFVAGIMIYISLDELLPTAHKYGGEHLSLAGLLAGMLVMTINRKSQLLPVNVPFLSPIIILAMRIEIHSFWQ